MTDEVSSTKNEAGGCIPGPASKESQGEYSVPGATGDAPANEELEWARRHVPEDPATLLVERKTEIIGWGVPAHKRERLLTAEVMVERIVIPVLERMQARLLAKIEALDGRIDRVEQALAARKVRRRARPDECGVAQ